MCIPMYINVQIFSVKILWTHIFYLCQMTQIFLRFPIVLNQIKTMELSSIFVLNFEFN